MKTRSELESEISQAIIRFKKEYMGRGPLSVRTYLLEDMALVRLQGVLTAAEQKLAQVEANAGVGNITESQWAAWKSEEFQAHPALPPRH
jgi:uncharacterized protein YbcI